MYQTLNFQLGDCNKIHSFLSLPSFLFPHSFRESFLSSAPTFSEGNGSVCVALFSSHHEKKKSQRKNHESVLIAFSVFSPPQTSILSLLGSVLFSLLFDYWTERIVLFKVQTNPDTNTVPWTGLRKLTLRPLNQLRVSSAVASERLFTRLWFMLQFRITKCVLLLYGKEMYGMELELHTVLTF
jgi:hypothetical protein